MSGAPRILIAAEHASARFGGEAALPLHYFRVLRGRGLPVWLVTHARTREELKLIYANDEHIVYVEDSAWHRAMWRIGKLLPDPVSYVTTGFLSRLSTQLAQRSIVRRLVREHAIDVVHQPMPVSPREPSMLFGFGVPVVIGPMNGGMNYPPAFGSKRGLAERLLLRVGRASASLLNLLMPGKRHAATLLVANRRTRDALPAGTCRHVVDLVENGVDLRLWHAEPEAPSSIANPVTTFAFMGRLTDLKAVDLLLHAFAKARGGAPMQLIILGDGAERERLKALAEQLDIAATPAADHAAGCVEFAGWLTQAECARRLAAADALVLPSLLECGGAVVLEAMSMAKPVVATAWGGPLDYLNANCGILITPSSREAIIEGFAAGMIALAKSPEERRRLGANGLLRVRTEFDWELKVDRILDIYRDAMVRGESIRNSASTAEPLQ